MGAYECWNTQKPRLRELLRDCDEKSGVVYAVRHALAQAEQNIMAEQPDDLLRQQAGILLSCCKTSAGLLDVSIHAKVWEVRPAKEEKREGFPLMLWLLAGIAQLGAGMYGYAKGQWVSWVLMLLAAAVAVFALLDMGRRGKRKREKAPEDVKVTLKLDEERLIHVLDNQMRAIDRFLNDFAYLNEQAAEEQAAPDSKTVSLAADMLEALYECDEMSRKAAEEAAARMLQGLGLTAVAYSGEQKRLFTVLPSKGETRTMIPAIVASDGYRLLRRGIAAVQQMEPAS